MSYYHDDWRETDTTLVAGKKYTPAQLDKIATAILRADAMREDCPTCQATEVNAQEKVPTCANGHTWQRSQSNRRGARGDDPVLFEDQMISRKRREIYNVNGVPDPSIVSGMYNRTHPEGRRVNSDRQRKLNASSFYR